MDLLFPDDGLVYQLEQVLTPSVSYRLFQNNFVPGLSSALGAFTEAAWAGYGGPISVAWAAFLINGFASHAGYAIAAPIVFGNTSGGPQTAYGYYVTDPGNTHVLACALFDAPAVIPSGQTLSVIPTWGDFSQLSS